MFQNNRIMLFMLFIAAYPLMADEGWIETEEFSYHVNSGQKLEVLLDVDAGEIAVEPNDSSGQCLIRLSYSMEDCDAFVDFREKSNVLKISLDKRGWGANGDDHLRAEILLPTDVEMAVKTKVKAGEVFFNVGGLRLEEFRLRVWAGEVSVYFDEPNPIIMKYLDINTSIGELNTSQLGNARFEKAKINGGIGEINVDFTGACLNNAMAKVDLDIGEADVILPSDRGVRISIGGAFGFLSSKNIDGDFRRQGRYYYTENFEEQEQSLSVRITPGLGELNVNCE